MSAIIENGSNVAAVTLVQRRAPSILAVQSLQELQAASLGFDFLLLPHCDFVAAARATGYALLVELDFGRPDAALLETHPDWFVHGAAGPAWRFLSEHDATVDWWMGHVHRAQQDGVAGFWCKAAHEAAPAVLRRIFAAARGRRADTLFMAEIFGASTKQVAALPDFDFVTSSSCFWDFRAGWLNAEASRLATVAPSIALAVPPGTFGWTRAALRRALNFSAIYAPGWAVPATLVGTDDGFAEEVSELLALRRAHAGLQRPEAARIVSSAGADIAVLTRGSLVCAVNATLDATPHSMPAVSLLPALGAAGLATVKDGVDIGPLGTISVGAGELALFEQRAASFVLAPAPALDFNRARIAIEAMTPQVDQGQFPVRRIVGDVLEISADLVTDGHDKIAGDVLVRAADDQTVWAYPLESLGNDRWRARVPLARLGRYFYSVRAWRDVYGTFVDELSKKYAAGVDTSLELREGLALVERAAEADERLRPLLDHLRKAEPGALREIFVSANVVAAMRHAGPRPFMTRSHEVAVDAERRAAQFASWYEVFPRSQSGDAKRHGTFADVATQLPRIAAMGFDVLYFPPIHPIGRKNRKGKNNSLKAGPDDPGSPYAIGSDEGGHDAIHPQLGSLDDFKALIAEAGKFGIELALDFAIQCAPDHPWLREHKGWFDWRLDGSLRYAENPPKKYEDIVNVDFYAEAAKPGLWLAFRDVVQFWVDAGVRLFRVDNPHTKPFAFWEWMIADIRSRHPDTVFLAEAFTRPKIMYRLAKIGFSQSYTYFTWRNTKAELTEYLTELSTTAPREFFRPHFFVNTPDINPVFLQNSGRAGFLIRAALAATLSGLWGVYNGFELCEAEPVPGKEEYLNSEKYEIKAWDYDRPGNIVAEISALNRIRHDNAALTNHVNVEFLNAAHPDVLFFRKFSEDGNCLLVAISLDPNFVVTATLELPLWRFGLADDGALAAEDLMRGVQFVWHGKYQSASFNPAELPFCIWRVSPVLGH